MPRQTALGFVQRANVICSAGDKHKKHFVTFGLWQSLHLWFPARLVPRLLLQNRAHNWNCGWIFSLEDPITDSAAQHVAGDVPGR